MTVLQSYYQDQNYTNTMHIMGD